MTNPAITPAPASAPVATTAPLIWTLTWDTDNGMGSSVHQTKAAAYWAYLTAETDDATFAEAKVHYDAAVASGDFDPLSEHLMTVRGRLHRAIDSYRVEPHALPWLTIHQGDMIPGRPDTLCAVILTVGDVVDAATEQGTKISEAQAQALLEGYGRRYSDAFLNDWMNVVGSVTDNYLQNVREDETAG